MAKSKARIHTVFLETVNQLADQVDKQAKAARGHDTRPWNRPDALVDPLDVPAITGFDRVEINANYEELLADSDAPGTSGDAISLKVQCDYVAARERAFRARHATPVRLIAMHVASRAGHGHPKGAFLGGALRYAQDALKAGQS